MNTLTAFQLGAMVGLAWAMFLVLFGTWQERRREARATPGPPDPWDMSQFKAPRRPFQ